MYEDVKPLEVPLFDNLSSVFCHIIFELLQNYYNEKLLSVTFAINYYFSNVTKFVKLHKARLKIFLWMWIVDSHDKKPWTAKAFKNDHTM